MTGFIDDLFANSNDPNSNSSNSNNSNPKSSNLNSSSSNLNSSSSNNDNAMPKKITSDEISIFLSKIQNKYSDNAKQKYLNQMYSAGILITNRKFNSQKLYRKLKKMIEDRSHDPIKKIREYNRKTLIDALKKGAEDGMSEEYRMVYDDCGRYTYNKDNLKKRAQIDKILAKFS